MLTKVMGIDKPLSHVITMLSWLGVYLLIGLMVVVANHLLNALENRTRSSILSATVLGLILVPMIKATIDGRLPYLDYFFPLPIIVICHVVRCLSNVGKCNAESPQWTSNVMSLSLSVSICPGFAHSSILQRFDYSLWFFSGSPERTRASQPSPQGPSILDEKDFRQ
jgi:hypothetical protein